MIPTLKEDLVVKTHLVTRVYIGDSDIGSVIGNVDLLTLVKDCVQKRKSKGEDTR